MPNVAGNMAWWPISFVFIYDIGMARSTCTPVPDYALVYFTSKCTEDSSDDRHNAKTTSARLARVCISMHAGRIRQNSVEAYMYNCGLSSSRQLHMGCAP